MPSQSPYESPSLRPSKPLPVDNEPFLLVDNAAEALLRQRCSLFFPRANPQAAPQRRNAQEFASPIQSLANGREHCRHIALRNERPVADLYAREPGLGEQ